VGLGTPGCSSPTTTPPTAPGREERGHTDLEVGASFLPRPNET